VESFEILDGGGTAKVEQVLADTEVTSAVAFSGANVCEGVFDGGPLAESSAARRAILLWL
jgi:hypothetical protein